MPTCSDGGKNQDETDADYDCTTKVCVQNVCKAGSCSDGQKNGAETDVECGGCTCTMCPKNKLWRVSADCASMMCKLNVCVAPSCFDGVKNQTESDIDCGGT